MNNNSALWPATTVASAIIILIAGVTITAIIKYDSVDEALKFWSALGSIVGVVSGAVVTYFFRQSEVKNAENKVVEAKAKEDETRKKSQELAASSIAAFTMLTNLIEPSKVSQYQNDPTIKAFRERASVLY